MSEADRNFEGLGGNQDRQNRRAETSSRGCLKLFAVLVLCSVACAGLVLLLIDVTNSGGRVKEAIADGLGLEAPEPEVRVVEKIVEVPVEKIVEKIVEIEVKEPMPSRWVSWKKVDTAELWNGIGVESSVQQSEGQTPSLERERDESYRIELTLHFAMPKPNQSVGALGSLNPHLPKMFSEFSTLVDGAEVSPFFYHLYELKTKRIQENATRLDKVLSRHNLYDCETILQIEHPETKRKVLLIQGEMDVVSDGSDGDRWPELDDYITMSDFYQPFTSYGWRKQTDTPNPLLARWEEKLKAYEEEFAITGLSIERNRYLREQIDFLKRGVLDMKNRSFLIAEADPFMVIPLSFLGRRDENPFGPAIGDFAVIAHENRLFPAIVGDAGPTYKAGEASLRIAKEINENASPYNRPESDLHVTYMVFPGTAEETRTPPDLARWHETCAALIEEIGGLAEGYELHQWSDWIAEKKSALEAESDSEGDDEQEGEADADATGDGTEGDDGSDAPDGAPPPPEEDAP